MTQSTQAPKSVTAASLGLATCHVCGKVAPIADHECPRCHAPLHLRKPESIERMWALLLAAVILYIPANLYPVMKIDQLGTVKNSTIIGGAVDLWLHGSYPISIVIFTASVLVPLGKMLSLLYLGLSVRLSRPKTLSQRTSLYRVTELIGRWSMVDVFVVAVLVALVQAGSVITIQPGPAALSFAGVVILTMFAAESFDPRLMWDAANRPPTTGGAHA